MKKILILVFIAAFGSLTIIAQPPSPPGNASSGNPAPVGGGAPIGSGVILMLSLFAAYGGKKTYDWHQEKD